MLTLREKWEQTRVESHTFESAKLIAVMHYVMTPRIFHCCSKLTNSQISERENEKQRKQRRLLNTHQDNELVSLQKKHKETNQDALFAILSHCTCHVCRILQKSLEDCIYSHFQPSGNHYQYAGDKRKSTRSCSTAGHLRHSTTFSLCIFFYKIIMERNK